MSATPIQVSDEAAIPRPRLLPMFDPLLLLGAVGLIACSLVTLKGATSQKVPGHPLYYVERQAIFAGIGLALALALSRIDYSRLREYKWGLFAVMIGLNLVVYGMPPIQGARRWIPLPFLNFQSSEFGKLLIIVALSGFAVDRSRRLHEWRTTARIMLLALIAALLVIPQPDLGTGMVYVAVGFSLLFFAGTSWKQLTALVTMFIASLAIVLAGAPALGVHVLKPYQVARLTAFLHPSSNPQTEGYQQQESKIAIGSGGKTGRANPTQTKLNFVPEDHTDFIFAAVGEQYGFAGAGLVLLLYALLIWRALRVLVMSKDLYGSLIAAGVAAMLIFQVFVNVGMSIGIMPITGVTLPLMSYGGSSVITTMLAVGLLQSIYVQARASAAFKGRVVRY